MKEIYELKEPIGRIKDPKDIFKRINSFKIDYKQENFIVIFLNTQNKVLGVECLFKGGLSECTIDPKVIFRRALIKNSSKIIISHNHPSNSLIPSYEDKDIFKRLKNIGNELNLNVLDSIIFNKNEYYSLLDKE